VEHGFTLAGARRKLHLWRQDYNHHRPHSALADRTPAEFAATCSGGKDGGKAALENAARFPPHGDGWDFSKEQQLLNPVD
jgi:hypothetical protein